MDDQAVAALQANPLFCGLSEQELLELVRRGSRLTVEPGTCLITEGEKGDALLVVLSGEIEVVRDSRGGEAQLARMGPGSFVGEMALIDDSPRNASVRTVTSAEILEITREQFDRLLDESPDACRNLVKTVMRRVKSTEAMLVNQEKLAGLGRLAAGLAHELNNPASAVSRFAEQLQVSLTVLRETTANLTGDRLPINRFSDQIGELSMRNVTAVEPHSALDEADREAQIATWLRDHQIGNPWDLAADLAAIGWNVEDLGNLAQHINNGDLEPAVRWLSTDAAISMTLQQLKISSARLTEIVASVKTYSHMDRSAAERTNVNTGLRSTLVILKHKLRSVDVQLDLDPDLPEIDAYPGELNQVWTNLIDNAIDAMNGSGSLVMTTSSGSDEVIVRIIDSGPGISQEHMQRLFEPFFTTKDVGVGTGLGLHISHNIVAQRHGGNIECISRPGRTEFIVTLPITR